MGEGEQEGREGETEERKRGEVKQDRAARREKSERQISKCKTERGKMCVGRIHRIKTHFHYITFIPASAKDRLSSLMLFIVPDYTGFTPIPIKPYEPSAQTE